MWILYLCIVISQTPVTDSPAIEIVEHDGTARLLYNKLLSGMPEIEARVWEEVSELKYDEIATELARRNQITAGDRALQIYTMSRLIQRVASGQITDPVSKKITFGSANPRFRALCRPYVDAIVLPELSIPAAPELLEAQKRMVSNFKDNSEETDRKRVYEQPELRKEYVRRYCLVWSRLIRSCLVYRGIYS